MGDRLDEILAELKEIKDRQLLLNGEVDIAYLVFEASSRNKSGYGKVKVIPWCSTISIIQGPY
jgi:hypothetical protein